MTRDDFKKIRLSLRMDRQIRNEQFLPDYGWVGQYKRGASRAMGAEPVGLLAVLKHNGLER